MARRVPHFQTHVRVERDQAASLVRPLRRGGRRGAARFGRQGHRTEVEDVRVGNKLTVNFLGAQ